MKFFLITFELKVLLLDDLVNKISFFLSVSILNSVTLSDAKLSNLKKIFDLFLKLLMFFPFLYLIRFHSSLSCLYLTSQL